MSRIKLGKHIDSGTFSKVYLMDNDDSDDSELVVKVVRRYTFETPLEKRLLDNEVKLCSKWPFSGTDGLVEVKGIEQRSGCSNGSGSVEWMFIMENGGENLEKFILRGGMKEITDLEKLGLLVDLLGAVDELERRGYRHLDIKPGNILVRRGKGKGSEWGEEAGIWRAKLCDYDMLLPVGMLQDIGNEIVGTMRYLPPMSKLDRGLGLQRCLWSLGMVFYEIVYGLYFIVDSETKWKGSQFDGLLKGMLGGDFDIKDCKYELQNLLASSKSEGV